MKKERPLPPPDEALDLFEAEARAGASDAWLAKQADVSLRQVSQWKRKKGISPEQGPVAETLSALRGLAASYEPSAHATTVAFEEPQYVLREPLDYTLFARASFALITVVGMTEAQVAQAFGIRPRDVEQALVLYRRHLSEHGTKCLGCDVLVSHKGFCSRRCHDAAIER